VFELSNTLERTELAAAEDGRTPVNRYSAPAAVLIGAMHLKRVDKLRKSFEAPNRD